MEESFNATEQNHVSVRESLALSIASIILILTTIKILAWALDGHCHRAKPLVLGVAFTAPEGVQPVRSDLSVRLSSTSRCAQYSFVGQRTACAFLRHAKALRAALCTITRMSQSVLFSFFDTPCYEVLEAGI